MSFNLDRNSLISIILPVYNAEKYIERALKSLINQSYKNIEVLCIDDGSKDNSYNIIKEFKDEKIKLFRQENSGPAKARNVGLSNSKGEYIMFCDADDWYEPNMCELMLETIIKQNVDFVICDSNIINTHSSNIRRKGEFDYLKLKLNGYYSINSCKFMTINSMLWNKIFKKNIIDKYDIKFIDGYEHDDSNFFFKYLSCCNNFYALNEKLYNYEISNPQSVMTLFFTNNINEKKKLDFLYSHHNLIDFIALHKFNEYVISEIIEMYKDSVLYFSRYLTNIQLNELAVIQKEFFKDKPQFDKYEYIREIKNTEVSKYIKRFDIKLSFLEWIFSLKNKSYNEKILTIFGFQISFKRYRSKK